MKIIMAACLYFVLIFGGVAGIVAYAADRGYQTLGEVTADLPGVWTMAIMFICTLAAVAMCLGWESYRRAVRGE